VDDRTFTKKKMECKKLCEIFEEIGCKNIMVVPRPKPKNIKQIEIIRESKVENISEVDADKIFIFHINDAENIPKKNLKDSHRLFPGDGIIPLREILFALKDIGYDKIVSVELFRPEYWKLEPEKVARITKEKTLKILEGLKCMLNLF
jgi:hypothetical protein